MKKKLKQLLALVLTLAVVMGFALPTAAADPGPRVTIEKVSNDAVTAEPEMHTAETKEDTPQYADTDMVRVSITLAGASTVDAGYATRSIANNAAADIYRTGLKVRPPGQTATPARAAVSPSSTPVRTPTTSPLTARRSSIPSSSWLPMRARARTSSLLLWICSMLTRSPLFCRS